jgi:dihydrofolate reductase
MGEQTTLTTGHIFIATSLDGFIARPDGNLDWLMKHQTPDKDHGYGELMDSVDGIVMGKGTFETVLAFDQWPYPKPLVVLSHTLKNSDIPHHLANRVSISAQEPDELMRSLAVDGWQHAYVDGGKVIQSFLRAGLIADMVVTRVPVLLGAGLPLFGALDHDIDLNHLETTAFASGLVSSRYEVIQP